MRQERRGTSNKIDLQRYCLKYLDTEGAEGREKESNLKCTHRILWWKNKIKMTRAVVNLYRKALKPETATSYTSAGLHHISSSFNCSF